MRQSAQAPQGEIGGSLPPRASIQDPMFAKGKKRTIKVSEEVYQALSHQAMEEEKTIEEIANAILVAGLSASSPYTYGEQYDPNSGKRIFRT